MAEQIDATVVILAFNGERYLRRLLTALREQRYSGTYEVLVIDSGSTDGTIGILADFSEIRVHEIPNEQFQHGRTRNLAARLARGERVVFLTQDAVPLGEHWLRKMLEPFDDYPQVRAVLGRQQPRAGCFPMLKREIRSVFAAQGPEQGVSIFRADPAASPVSGEATFYSDVCSAAPRRFLLEELPYHEVEYAEDQLFGRDVLAAGYSKAYAGEAVVEHSNDLNRAELGRRVFDETAGLRRIGLTEGVPSRRHVVRLIIRDLLYGVRDSLRDPEYSTARKLYWLVVNPAYVVTKWWAAYRASTVDLDDEQVISSRSLEARRRAGRG